MMISKNGRLVLVLSAIWLMACIPKPTPSNSGTVVVGPGQVISVPKPQCSPGTTEDTTTNASVDCSGGANADIKDANGNITGKCISKGDFTIKCTTPPGLCSPGGVKQITDKGVECNNGNSSASANNGSIAVNNPGPGTVIINPKPATTTPKTFGPYSVVGGDVHTGVSVEAGKPVRITASGTVDFGGAVFGFGAPKLGPDGDGEPAPDGYPARNLRKNSLIAKVGSRWYQGGADNVFTPSDSGELIFRSNDSEVNDNSRGWSVSVYY